MKLVIFGGSGQIGTLTARAFQASGDTVVSISRSVRGGKPWRELQWDGKTVGDWSKELDGADVVLNLAGRSVNCRYNAANRHEILQSRVDSVKVVELAIQTVNVRPKVWLQAGTATIYAHRFDAGNEERSGIIGGAEDFAPDTWRFSIDVAKAWENALHDTAVDGVRKVILRTAMTMSPDKNGVFDVYKTLVYRGLGGAAGDGKQYVSWIHEVDFVNALRFIVANENLDGPINVCSPNPLPNGQFMKILRDLCHKRAVLSKVPVWALELGARAMGTETELIHKSRRVVPGRLLAAGFQFQYPDWHTAAKELLSRGN